MIEYRQAVLEDMNEIAKLHIQIFDGYFLSLFGEQLVEKYYEEFFCENNLFMLALEENKIIGFCMGYLNGSAAREKFERKYAKALTVQMLKLCLCLNKLALSKGASKIKNMLHRKPERTQEDENIEGTVRGDLLSIGVLPDYRGKQVSEKLVDGFESLLRTASENKAAYYTLSVRKENSRARAFYEKMGFFILKEQEDEFKYKKMLK